jgi:hypothetical protein
MSPLVSNGPVNSIDERQFLPQVPRREQDGSAQEGVDTVQPPQFHSMWEDNCAGWWYAVQVCSRSVHLGSVADLDTV